MKPPLIHLAAACGLLLVAAPSFAQAPGTVIRDCAECPELVVIPAGRFAMGSPASEEGHNDDEGPVREVSVPAFAAGRYEVTVAEYKACVDAGACPSVREDGFGGGSRPVTFVSWEEGQAYARWLSGKTGKTYRLLSEAEWEYAARAGSAGRYCFGDDLGCSEANTGSFQIVGRSVAGWRRFLPFCAPMNQALDVGMYPANIWGLHDVHGNVWEFTSDLWQGPADPNSPGKTGRWYVTKGGSWFESAWQARSCARKPRWFDELDVNLGFRVLREIP